MCAGTCDEGLARVAEMESDLVFSDVILDGKTGVDFLRECRERNLSCPVIMITGYPTLETAYDAVRLGAFDYLTKPIEPVTLLHVTELALQHKRVTDEKEEFRSRLDAIFRSVEDSIVTVDRDLVVTEVNEAAKNICGFDRESIGKDMVTIFMSSTTELLVLGCRNRFRSVLGDFLDLVCSVLGCFFYSVRGFVHRLASFFHGLVDFFSSPLSRTLALLFATCTYAERQ